MRRHSDRGKIKPLYTLTGRDYRVEWYDFQYYKKSDPPGLDDEPEILYHPGVRIFEPGNAVEKKTADD